MKTITAANFFSRAERLAQINVPENTPSLLIVRPNDKGIGYRFDSYSETFEASISKVDFDRIVRHCHKIVESIYLQKRREEEAPYISFIKNSMILVGVLLLATIIVLIVMAYSSKGEDINPAFLYISLVLVCVVTGTVAFAAVKTYLTNPKFTAMESTTRKKLYEYLSEENAQARQKGIEWVMGKDYFWIELHKIQDQSNLENQHMKFPSARPLLDPHEE